MPRKYLCPAVKYIDGVKGECLQALPCLNHNVLTPAMSYAVYGKMLVELTDEEMQHDDV